MDFDWLRQIERIWKALLMLQHDVVVLPHGRRTRVKAVTSLLIRILLYLAQTPPNLADYS
jgi:hypothetical protein